MNRDVPVCGRPRKWGRPFVLRLSRVLLLAIGGILMVNVPVVGQGPTPFPSPRTQNSPTTTTVNPFPFKNPLPSTLPAFAPLPVSAQEPERPKGPETLPLPEKNPLPAPATSPVPSPFPPGAYRLPLLDPNSRPYAPGDRTPVPTAKDLAEINLFVDEVVDPRSTMDLIQNRPRLLKLKENPTKTQVGDPKVAQMEVLGQRQISILGLQVGTTVLNLWFKDPEDDKKERVLSYLLRVVPDPEQKARLEGVYRALAREINAAFPDAQVCLTLVGDKVVVSGQAKDVAEATQILRVVQANSPQGQGQNGIPNQNKEGQIPVSNVNLVVQPGELPGGAPNLSEFLNGGASNVINMMRIAGEQQVALKVIVAEIDRSAARSIGMDFNITNNGGVTIFGSNTGGLLTAGLGMGLGGIGGAGGAGGAGGIGGIGGGFPIAPANLKANLDNGQITLAMSALRRLRYAKLLAEPTLTALNGQTASFQAGGSFPVPVVTGFTAAGLQGVQFVPFGVQVQFTPIVTDRDRIRLQVRAEVSATDSGNATNIGGAAINGLQSRNFQSVVELREGQTLAVAGLIQNTNRMESDRVPFLGDIPILGRLAGFDQNTSNERELVILVTPQLVHPMDKEEVPALPGSDVFEPSDMEFYFWGRLESYRPVDYRTAARTDLHKMLQYRKCEEKYIYGQSGHSDTPPPVSNLPRGPFGRPANVTTNCQTCVPQGKP